MKDTEKITISGYEVEIQHRPQFGFSTAFYNGRIIADCQLGRITQPMSDDDREWEMYEERFSEWRDEVLSNLKLSCKHYFNRKNYP